MGLLATLTGLRLLRFILRIIAFMVVAILVYLAVTAVQVWNTGRRYQPRSAGAIIVMGAAQYNGVPSPDLASRLTQAESLWRQHYASTIMVTGSKEPGDQFTEAQASARYLLAAGIPGRDVIESGGSDSWQNLSQAAPALRERGGQYRSDRDRPVSRGPQPGHCVVGRVDPLPDAHPDVANPRLVDHPLLRQGDGRSGAGSDHRVRPPEPAAHLPRMITPADR